MAYKTTAYKTSFLNKTTAFIRKPYRNIIISKDEALMRFSLLVVSSSINKTIYAKLKAF